MYDRFKDITGYDIQNFFERFVKFVLDNSKKIIDFYSGELSELDRDSYEVFLSLREEVNEVLGLFELNQTMFIYVDFWQLLEFTEEIQEKLEVINSFWKFSRSVRINGAFNKETVILERLRSDETLEEFIGRFGSTDRDQDWVKVALDNSLIQEEYDNYGDKILKLNFKNNLNFRVNSIIGEPIQEKIKGTDLDKEFIFEENDLKVLNYDDSLYQDIGILLGLLKNDNPEFYHYGVDKSMVVGSNMKMAVIPILIRQVYQTFSTDDLVDRIEIINTNLQQDSISLELNIYIKTGESISKKLVV